MTEFHGHPQRELSGHSGVNDSIFALVVSPDGRYLYSGSYDATVAVWSLSPRSPPPDEGASGIPERLAVLRGHTDKINALAVASQNPGFLACASDDSTVSVWNMAETPDASPVSGHHHHRRPTHALRLIPRPANGAQCALVAKSDGRTVFAAGLDRVVRAWFVPPADPTGGGSPGLSTVTVTSCAFILRGHAKEIWSLALSASEQVLLSGGSDHKVIVWDVHGVDPTIHDADTSKPVALRMLEHSGTVRALRMTPDDSCLFVGTLDKTRSNLVVWQLDKRHVLRMPASSSSSRHLTQLEPRRVEDAPAHEHAGGICALDVLVLPQGTMLLTGSEDGSVGVWRVVRGGSTGLSLTFMARWSQASPVKSLAISREGTAFAGCHNGKVRMWHATRGPPPAPVPLAREPEVPAHILEEARVLRELGIGCARPAFM